MKNTLASLPPGDIGHHVRVLGDLEQRPEAGQHFAGQRPREFGEEIIAESLGLLRLFAERRLGRFPACRLTIEACPSMTLDRYGHLFPRGDGPASCLSGVTRAREPGASGSATAIAGRCGERANNYASGRAGRRPRQAHSPGD